MIPIHKTTLLSKFPLWAVFSTEQRNTLHWLELFEPQPLYSCGEGRWGDT